MPFQKNNIANPRGRPSVGASFGEIIKEVGDMTPADLAEIFPALAEEVRSKFGEITLKKAMVLRVFQSLLANPNAKLFSELMDRSEGKVADKLEITDWRQEAIAAGLDPDKIIEGAELLFIEQLSGTSDKGSTE